MSDDTRRIKVVITGESSSAEDAFKKTAKAAEDAGGVMDKVGDVLDRFGPGLLAAQGMDDLKDAFDKVIDGAMDLQTMMNRTDVVFGTNAQAIEAWAGTTATSLGISKNAALEGMTTFGNLFTAMGVGKDQIVGMSEKLVTLAGNFAAWGNTDPSKVMEALAAATRGEYDALQKFIPSLSQTGIEQEAMAESGKKSASQLTNSEKIMALYTIVTTQAGDASTYLATGTDSAAQQQRVFEAQVSNTAASIGQKLLPAYGGFLSIINDVGPITTLGVIAEAVVGTTLVRSFQQGTGATGQFRQAITLANEEMGSAALAGQNLATAQRNVSYVTGDFAAILGGTSARMSIAQAEGNVLKASLIGLQGAGNAAKLGFSNMISFLGGPWVAGMMIATAAIGYFYQQSQKEKSALAELQTQLASYGQALSGGFTSANLASAQSILAQNTALRDLVTNSQAAGISAETLVAGLNGDASARQEVIDKLNAQRDATIQQMDSMKQLGMSNYDQLRALQAHADALEKDRIAFAKQNTAMSQASQLTQQIEQDTKSSTAAFDDAPGAVQTYYKSLQTLTDVTKTYTDKASAMKSMEDTLYGSARGLADAEEAQAKALLTVKESLDNKDAATKKAARSLKEDTDAGIQSIDTLKSSIQAINDEYNARVTNGESIDSAIQKHDAEINTLKNVAAQQGYNKQNLQQLITTYGQVPKMTQTDISTSGFDTTADQLKELLAYQYALKNGVSYDVALGKIDAPSSTKPQSGSSLGHPAAFAHGGLALGQGTGTSDDIDAKLSNYEYVQPEGTVRHYGVDFMDAIRARRVPKQLVAHYASGGLVGDTDFDPFPVSTAAAKMPTRQDILKQFIGATSLYQGPITGDIVSAQNWLRAQNGKPYVWDAAGPGGYDCSGLVSAVWNLVHGRNPYSHTFSTESEDPYFPKRGQYGVLTAGWSHPGERGASAGVGHTAGNLAGLPFESRGSRGVIVGNEAVPVTSFARFGTFDQGGVLPPGVTFAQNLTGKDEYILTPDQLAGASGGITVNVTVQGNVTTEKDLAASIALAVRNELLNHAKRNGGKTGL